MMESITSLIFDRVLSMAWRMIGSLGFPGIIALVAGIVLLIGAKRFLTSPRGMLIAAGVLVAALAVTRFASPRLGWAGAGGRAGSLAAKARAKASAKNQWRRINEQADEANSRAMAGMMAGMGAEGGMPIPGTGPSGLINQPKPGQYARPGPWHSNGSSHTSTFMGPREVVTAAHPAPAGVPSAMPLLTQPAAIVTKSTPNATAPSGQSSPSPTTATAPTASPAAVAPTAPTVAAVAPVPDAKAAPGAAVAKIPPAQPSNGGRHARPVTPQAVQRYGLSAAQKAKAQARYAQAEADTATYHQFMQQQWNAAGLNGHHAVPGHGMHPAAGHHGPGHQTPVHPGHAGGAHRVTPP